MTSLRTPRWRCGFTLIEMLIVITVISVSCMILVPAVAKVRDTGQQTHCLSNLRQWGIALSLYLSITPSQEFPTEGFGSSGQVDIQESSAWFNVLPPLVGQVSLLERDNLGERMPRPRDRSLWTCNEIPSSTAQHYQTRTPFFSYAYNLWIDHASREAEHSRAGLESRLPELLRFSNISNPSAFVLLGEHRSDSGRGRFPNCHAYHLAYRHNGEKQVSNLVFADGHAQGFEKSAIYVDHSEPNWKLVNRGNIVWDPEGIF